MWVQTPKLGNLIEHDSSLVEIAGKWALWNVAPRSVMMAHSVKIAHTKPPDSSFPHTSLANTRGRVSDPRLAWCMGRRAAPGPTRAKVILACGLITLVFCLERVAVKLARYCPQQPPAFRPVGVE